MASDMYWLDRIRQEMEWHQEQSFEHQRQIDEIYENALYNIERDILAEFQRYGDDNNLTMQEMGRMVSDTDIKLLGLKAEQYVQNQDFSERANEEMKQYNFQGRVSRERLLKSNLRLATHQLANDEEKLIEEKLFETSYRQAENYAGIWAMSVPEVDTLRAMMTTINNTPFKGGVWSDRIWDRQNALAEKLSRDIDRIIIQGQNSTVLIRDLRNAFNVSRYEAKRLLVTETARVQSETQKELMSYNGFDKYVYMPEPTACPDCLALEDLVFDVKDMTPGLNSAPMHPNCRCSTAPYMEDVIPQIESPYDIPENEIDESIDIEALRKQAIDNLNSTNLKRVRKAEYNGFIRHMNTITDPDTLKMYSQLGTRLDYTTQRLGSSFNTFTKKIRVNPSDFKGGYGEKPYSVVHHENGHAFDHFGLIKLASQGEQVVFDGQPVRYASELPKYGLEDKIYNDFWKHINGDLEQLPKMNTRPRGRAEREAWEERRLEIATTARKNYENFEREMKAFQRENDENRNAVFVLSDIIESTQMVGELPLGAGHGDSYWTIIGRKEAEFFANTTLSKADDDIALGLIKEIFPESYKAYEEIVNDITKE